MNRTTFSNDLRFRRLECLWKRPTIVAETWNFSKSGMCLNSSPWHALYHTLPCRHDLRRPGLHPFNIMYATHSSPGKSSSDENWRTAGIASLERKRFQTPGAKRNTKCSRYPLGFDYACPPREYEIMEKLRIQDYENEKGRGNETTKRLYPTNLQLPPPRHCPDYTSWTESALFLRARAVSVMKPTDITLFALKLIPSALRDYKNARALFKTMKLLMTKKMQLTGAQLQSNYSLTKANWQRSYNAERSPLLLTLNFYLFKASRGLRTTYTNTQT